MEANREESVLTRDIVSNIEANRDDSIPLLSITNEGHCQGQQKPNGQIPNKETPAAQQKLVWKTLVVMLVLLLLPL